MRQTRGRDYIVATETIHICGCVTRFDTLNWRSVTITRCEGHAEQERLAERAFDAAGLVATGDGHD